LKFLTKSMQSMKVKILEIRQFKGHNSKEFINYQVSIDGTKVWISQLDYAKHSDLISIEGDYIILKEPPEDYYEVLKKENVKGKFQTLIPKLKSDFSKIVLPAEEKEMKMTVFKNCIDHPSTNNEKKKVLRKVIYPKRKLVISPKASKTISYPEVIPGIDRDSFSETPITKAGSKPIGDKTAFINGLLKMSNRKDVTEKTRERLINLLSKEALGNDDVLKEIQNDIIELRKYVGLEEGNLDASVNGRIIKEIIKQNVDEEKKNNIISERDDKKNYTIIHKPSETSALLKKFKYNNPSGFKELVHKPTEESYTIKDYNDIIERAKSSFKNLRNVPFEIYKSIEQLINLMENEGKECFVSTNNHPYLNESCAMLDLFKVEKNYNLISPKGEILFISYIIQNFKKQYRFDNEKTEASILRELILNVFKNKKLYFVNEDQKKRYCFSDSVSDEQKLSHCTYIVLEILQENFDNLASFFTWVPYIRNALWEIALDILKHGNLNGSREFKSFEKKVSFEVERVFDELAGQRLVIFIITDYETISSKLPEVLFEELKAGNYFNKHFKGICDWTINYDIDNGESYQLKMLPECPKTEAIVKLKEKSNGYKHILTFYD